MKAKWGVIRQGDREICEASFSWLPRPKDDPTHFEMMLGKREAGPLRRGQVYEVPIQGKPVIRPRYFKAKVLGKTAIDQNIVVVLFEAIANA